MDHSFAMRTRLPLAAEECPPALAASAHSEGTLLDKPGIRDRRQHRSTAIPYRAHRTRSPATTWLSRRPLLPRLTIARLHLYESPFRPAQGSVCTLSQPRTSPENS